MYVPDMFREDDLEFVLGFMQDNNFPTIVSVDGNLPVASHLPVTVRRNDVEIVIRGHFAKANPHWRTLDGSDSLAIFIGPHAYVSPAHYDRRQSVPTWNYLVVHAYGRARALDDEETLEGLHELIADNEPHYRQQWDGLPESYRNGMLRGVVGFELAVTQVRGAAKLSQDKSRRERERIAAALVSYESEHERELGHEMHRRLEEEKVPR